MLFNTDPDLILLHFTVKSSRQSLGKKITFILNNLGFEMPASFEDSGMKLILKIRSLLLEVDAEENAAGGVASEFESRKISVIITLLILLIGKKRNQKPR